MIIIKQALLYKAISEYAIKRVTSQSYNLNFQPALRRLVNIKVLLRDASGKLFINPVVVNDITKIVHHKIDKP